MLFPKFELPSVTGHHLISPLRGISSPHTHTWNFPSVTIPTYCCFSLFIWLCQVFVAARGTSSCGMWTLSCGTWDLVPWPGMKLGPLHCEWSLSHWTMREVTYEGVFSYWISYRSSLVPSSFFFPLIKNVQAWGGLFQWGFAAPGYNRSWCLRSRSGGSCITSCVPMRSTWRLL